MELINPVSYQNKREIPPIVCLEIHKDQGFFGMVNPLPSNALETNPDFPNLIDKSIAGLYIARML